MQVMFLDAPYSGKVKLNKEIIKLVQNKKVGLFASVQFVNKLDVVKEQLNEAKIEFFQSKPRRTHVKGQILGCDTEQESLNLEQEIDVYLYIGDGKFHPLALIYAQKDQEEIKPLYQFDPITNLIKELKVDEIKKNLMQYRASLMKFVSAENIGVINTIKPGQQQLKASYILEKKWPEKKFYYFVDNIVSFDQLENFNFIYTWINTTCPRVGFDDQDKFLKGIINLNDALIALDVLSKNTIFNRLRG